MESGEEDWGVKRTVRIKSTDMKREMQQEAVSLADRSMKESSVEMDIAKRIKRGFDLKYHPGPWHCIVGRKFGSFVTHESGNFLYFYIGHIAIVIFKSKD